MIFLNIHISLNNDTGRHPLIKTEIFDGKKFIALKSDYEITSKRVATTQSGKGYGVSKNGETVIPFEYDWITEYGEYFVAEKKNSDDYLDETFDIYDKNFNKTAENIEYAFYGRYDEHGQDCLLPNGYFQIEIEHDSKTVFGIVDYTGKIIVEPVFYRGIKLWTYEGTGAFL